MLDVPVSLETGYSDLSVDFYDRNSRMDYGTVDQTLTELVVGNDVIDCRTVTTDGVETYRPCANVVLEGWWDEYTRYDHLELPRGLGVNGETHWWVPKFTAAKDPTLVSYLGLSGETNRRKLAETFKRPTTWKKYCEDVSVDKCSSDDGVAARAPQNEFEEESMFADGVYTGYFRATEENDCDNFPDSCTGHIADFPCGWTVRACTT